MRTDTFCDHFSTVLFDGYTKHCCADTSLQSYRGKMTIAYSPSPRYGKCSYCASSCLPVSCLCVTSHPSNLLFWLLSLAHIFTLSFKHLVLFCNFTVMQCAEATGVCTPCIKANFLHPYQGLTKKETWKGATEISSWPFWYSLPTPKNHSYRNLRSTKNTSNDINQPCSWQKQINRYDPLVTAHITLFRLQQLCK